MFLLVKLDAVLTLLSGGWANITFPWDQDATKTDLESFSGQHLGDTVIG